MSRSYRKGMQCCCTKDFKKIYNRRLRRTDILDDIDNCPASYRRLNEPWEIADYRCGFDDMDSWGWMQELTEEERIKAKNKYRSK